jgi:hypothetical protein
MKVYLDDQREAPEGWVRTKTPAETIELLKSGQVEVLSLDHDLGEDESVGTGYHVLLWLEKEVYTKDFKPPTDMRVHSANSAARPKMEQAIEQIKRYAERNLENGSD